MEIKKVRIKGFFIKDKEQFIILTKADPNKN